MGYQFVQTLDFTLQVIESTRPLLHLVSGLHALGLLTERTHLEVASWHDKHAQTSGQTVTNIIWIHKTLERCAGTRSHHILMNGNEAIHAILVTIVHTVHLVMEAVEHDITLLLKRA